MNSMHKHRGAFGLPLLVVLLLIGLIGSGWFLFHWLNNTNPHFSEKSAEQVAVESQQVQVSEKVHRQTLSESADRVIEQKTDAQQTEQTTAPAIEGLNPAEIGASPWSDAEFDRLTALLKKHPEMIEQLALEFRINTDPQRSKRLAMLLGQFDNPIIAEVGAELAFSGDPVSQKTGLRLLGRLQPHSPRARETVADLLSVESNPEVLVSALNAMAKPARTSEAEQKDLLDRFSRLAKNNDPVVRSHSMAIISRWARDINMNEILLQGLDDSDPKVRETAAFSLIKTRHMSEEVKNGLLAKIEDSNERKRTREAALYALQRFDLNPDEQARYAKSHEDIQKKTASVRGSCYLIEPIFSPIFSCSPFCRL